MGHMLKNIRSLWKLSGFNFKTLSRSLRSAPYFLRTASEFKKQARASDEPFELGQLRPVLDERYKQAGSTQGHYFLQDLYVAQKVYQANPERHIDVGSRIDGFVAHVATHRAIEVIDVRPLEPLTDRITFLCADMMAPLPQELVACTDSLSCLHAIEHFGLGRYGDPIDFEGHLKGFDNFQRMLKPGGTFYFSTPVGEQQRVEFNAHRVFSLPYLVGQFEPFYDTISFAFIDDQGQLHTDADPQSKDAQRSFGMKFGCAIFELVRR